MYKNVASQKAAVFAWDSSNEEPKTGDAGNITGQISKDGGATAATDDTNPTELDSTDAPGVYIFDLTQAETNCDLFVLFAKSSTADIDLEPVIAYTLPGDNSALDANVAEVSDDSTAADNLELITELSNITSLVVDANGRVDVGSIEGGDATDAINSEVDTAIETYHLDHLLAADYDPSAKPGVATALLNELVENDGGVSRFTSNALEAITDDDTQIDASALNTLSGHDPGSTIAAQTDVTGLNDLSAADVNAEVDTAIETYHLDHLLAADYDPASKPGVATALLNELVESDGGVSRFTANALEAITDDDTQIDASALNTLSGHDPGSTIAAQTDVTGLNDLSAADVLSAITDDDNKIDGSALNTLSGHDPGGTIAAQTDVTGLNDLSAADVLSAVTDDDNKIDGSALNALTGVANIASLTIDASGHVEANIVETNDNANVEGTLDLTEVLRIMLAALAGQSTGGGTTSVAFRDVADAKDRIAATVDADGNRTAITLDGS